MTQLRELDCGSNLEVRIHDYFDGHPSCDFCHGKRGVCFECCHAVVSPTNCVWLVKRRLTWRDHWFLKRLITCFRCASS